MRRSRGPLYATLFAAFLGASLGTPAAAQSADPDDAAANAARAKQLFEEGREAVRAGDFAGGCPKMAESHELVPSIGALFNLALCSEHDGDLLEARTRWHRAVQLSKELADERQKLAEERLRELEAEIPTVEVVISRGTDVSKPPSGAIGELDGNLVSPRALQQPIEMNPGEHEIAVTVAGRPPASVTFEVARGDHITVSVPLPATKPEPQPVTSDEGEPYRAVGYVLLGVGAASFVVSAVTGAMYLGERSTVDEHCNDVLQCDQEGLDAASSAGTLGMINGVTFLGGLFAATAGVALVFLAPDGSEVQAKPAVGWSSGAMQLEATW